jgi:hypothetical protein
VHSRRLPCKAQEFNFIGFLTLPDFPASWKSEAYSTKPAKPEAVNVALRTTCGKAALIRPQILSQRQKKLA